MRARETADKDVELDFVDRVEQRVDFVEQDVRVFGSVAIHRWHVVRKAHLPPQSRRTLYCRPKLATHSLEDEGLVEVVDIAEDILQEFGNGEGPANSGSRRHSEER